MPLCGEFLQARERVEMDDSIAKWEKFCEGGSKYDSSDFTGLLSRRWSDDDLAIIFRRFPLKDSVIENLKSVYRNAQVGRGVYLRPKRQNAGTPDQLVSLIMSFIASQKHDLLKCNIDEETRRWFEQTGIEFSFVDMDTLRSVDPNDDVVPYIREEEVEHREYRPEALLNISNADCVEYRVMSGVKEALYGLASDYNLAWFVLSPLFDTEINYSKYFEFWRKGGVYALTDSHVLAASIWGDLDD